MQQLLNYAQDEEMQHTFLGHVFFYNTLSCCCVTIILIKLKMKTVWRFSEAMLFNHSPYYSSGDL